MTGNSTHSGPMELYESLYAAYGPQHWWPAKSVMEMMVGAILVQNTAWTQAAKAVDALAANNLLSADGLLGVDDEILWGLIRPAGYFRVKARRLKSLAAFLAGYDDLGDLFSLETMELRRRLLRVNGVGKETADSIICYGARQPIFVVDAYTYRLFSRIGWVGEESDYDEMQELVHGSVPMETKLLGEFHALIVRHAKEHCRVRPVCNGCPVEFCQSRNEPDE